MMLGGLVRWSVKSRLNLNIQTASFSATLSGTSSITALPEYSVYFWLIIAVNLSIIGVCYFAGGTMERERR